MVVLGSPFADTMSSGSATVIRMLEALKRIEVSICCDISFDEIVGYPWSYMNH